MFDEAESNDDSDSYGSFGLFPLMDDLSTPSLDTNYIATGNLDLDPSQSQLDGAEFINEAELLPDDYLEEPTTDQAESIFTDDPDAAYTGEISQSPRRMSVIYSYICSEFDEACVQYAEGMPTGEILYAKCNIRGIYCRLCDSSGQKCMPGAGWDKQAIPSPDNPYGQPWNHCRNKQCGGCEAAARFFGFLSLGIIPSCGPPKFE